MRILWISMNDGLLQQGGSKGYNGIGWIASLQALFEQTENHIGLVFLSSEQKEPLTKNNTDYFPIFKKPLNSLRKLFSYYFPTKKADREEFVDDILKIISHFKPDIIHLFGIENPLANIVGKTNIPVFVHLQGILTPCTNAAFPPGFNTISFLLPFSIREWLFRNGFIFNWKQLKTRTLLEKKLLSETNFFLGRTKWDYEIAKLFAPESTYFHINEVLRSSFYANAGQWKWKKDRKTIVSTISPTSYKGLDLILKTANVLKEFFGHKYEWLVVGIDRQSHIIPIFERQTHIKSENVNVVLRGVLNEKQLAELLLSSFVYVHPSYIENSSNSICEAQMLGLPVVATDVGGTSSIVNDNINGLLVPANDPYQLAYRIHLLNQDDILANKLSRQASKIAASRHDKATILSDLLNAYSSVLK